MSKSNKRVITLVVLLVVALGGYYGWRQMQAPALPAGIAAANGRTEATEIDIAALTGGRIEEITVAEGDFVTSGTVLVQMDVVQLNAQKRQAEAQLRRAEIAVETAKVQVTQAEAEERATVANVEQAQAVAEAAAQRHARTAELVARNVASQQLLDDDLAADRQGRAGVASAEASHAAAVAGINTARAQIVDAEAAVEAAQAEIEVITKSIDDATLTAPRDGRIQYLIAEEGEVVASGGRILNLVDLNDVYMTIFLPTSQAGLVRLGAEVRLVMDAAPDHVIPSMVSYVADVAQFTPKTVETADEREKLMFRVRARIDPELLARYLDFVKTGLPGMAYVQLDPNAEWPGFLANVVQ